MIFYHIHGLSFYLCQVANAGRDHGMWLRPEDIDYVQKSYKIDVNNAGSDVAAETAAAMAAASIVFRSSNPTYANTLVAHAKELYEFADRYRYKKKNKLGVICFSSNFML